VPEEFLARVFDTMEAVDRHILLVLTKRPDRAANFTRRATPDARRRRTSGWERASRARTCSSGSTSSGAPLCTYAFLSCEPLLGSLRDLTLDGIHWLIAGGESGFRHRPIDPTWVRELRDLCLSEGVAFFFKQWGGRTPKAGGRRLDGRLWSEYPSVPVRPSGGDASSAGSPTRGLAAVPGSRVDRVRARGGRARLGAPTNERGHDFWDESSRSDRGPEQPLWWERRSRARRRGRGRRSTRGARDRS